MKNGKYFKNRAHKVSSVNIEFYQADFIALKKLNLSAITRDLLEKFLVENYGQKYLTLKHDFLINEGKEND